MIHDKVPLRSRLLADFIQWHVSVFEDVPFIAFQCNHLIAAYIIFCFCLSVGCSAFSVGDILEMDVEISKLPEFSMVESGPLILAWAVFLCLVLSLPESNTNLVMMTF